MVTSILMSRRAKIFIANIAQIGKPNIRGIVSHLRNDIFYFSHAEDSINIDTYVKTFLTHTCHQNFFALIVSLR